MVNLTYDCVLIEPYCYPFLEERVHQDVAAAVVVYSTEEKKTNHPYNFL